MIGNASLVISTDPAVVEAFIAIGAGLRSGQSKESLRGYLECLQAAEDRAFATPEGKAYLEDRRSPKHRH